MYKIIDEQFKSGALSIMHLLNDLHIFDHLSEKEMEEVELEVIKFIESKLKEKSDE